MAKRTLRRPKPYDPKRKFGVERLLFASDYAPCLNLKTYPQTLELLWKMPFLSDDDRDRIAGGNLMALLQEAAATR